MNLLECMGKMLWGCQSCEHSIIFHIRLPLLTICFISKTFESPVLEIYHHTSPSSNRFKCYFKLLFLILVSYYLEIIYLYSADFPNYFKLQIVLSFITKTVLGNDCNIVLPFLYIFILNRVIDHLLILTSGKE